MAISVSYPYVLQNGTTADATQVMADFYQIQNDVNANAAHNGANSDITSLTGLTTPLSVSQGGTGADTAAGARTALGLGAAAVEGLGGYIVDSGGNLALSSSTVLPNGTTATTQSASNNSTKVATTAYADGAVATAIGTALLKANNLSDLGSLATALTNLGFNTSGIGSTGSYTLPGGLIVKWGAGDTTSGNPQTITFGTAFPTACFAAFACVKGASDGKRSAAIGTISASAITVYTGEGSAGNEPFAFSWIAVGN